MNPRSRKALSWSVSIVVHATILFFVGRAALNYALPEGEVDTNPTTIDVVTGPQGEQTEFKPVEPVAPKEEPQKRTAKTKKAAIQQDDSPVKFLPDKDFNEVKPAPPEEDSDQTAKNSATQEPVPEAIPEKTKEDLNEDQAVENTDNVPQALPKKEDVAQAVALAAQAATEATPSENPTENTATPLQPPGQTDANGAPVGAENAAPPAYGTPGTFLDISKLTERPGNAKPSYPFVARFRHQEGLVIVRAYIRKDGHVDLPILEKSSGYSNLDQEALRAFSHWRFEPPSQGGWVLKPFQFNLKK